MSFRSFRCSLVTATLALLLATVPAAAQNYNYFPGGVATDDGRTVALAGDNFETLSQDYMTFIVAVPPGERSFELGIFDGDTGRTSGGRQHWDNGATQLQYALFYDPYQQGSTDPANLVGVWQGNATNPTAGAQGEWSASSATFPDNDWWNLTVLVPEPPEPLPGQSPSGATFYHLCVSYAAQTGNGLPDPCTGGIRPPDASPSTVSNFKLRATANISVLSFAFAYEAAMRAAATHADVTTIYPTYQAPIPNPQFFLTAPTTYDGSWTFTLDMPTSSEEVILFGGDFDFGTDLTTGLPSGVAIQPCYDTDDPDTPNTVVFPDFATMDGLRIDDSLPEGARTAGSPPDDNRFDIFRRTPCIYWTLTSPGPDGDLTTSFDNVAYVNHNPSSQREWEQFKVSAAPACSSSPVCDPLLETCADYCEADLLPAGVWQLDVFGVDLSNLNAWRSEQLNSFCLNCELLPRPYLVGDTVFEDVDGDGTQDPGEPGISNVLVELLDGNGRVLATRRTGDPSTYETAAEWQACRDRNTGADQPVDEAGLYCFDVSVPNDSEGVDQERYSVRIADESFQAGGGLYDHFGGVPEATRPSPEQTGTVVEGGGNVMTYDFGYYLPLVSLGDRVWLDADGDGMQDAGEAGIDGVTVELYDGKGDLVATTTTAGDGEYLFAGLMPGTYTVRVDATTLPPGLTATYDLDGLQTAHEATVQLDAGQNRRDVDFGYTPCGACDGKITRLTFQYLGDETALVEIHGRRGPLKNDPLFAGIVEPGATFEVVGPDTGNGGFKGTLGTEISLSVDGAEEATLHTSCSQPVGPGTVAGPFVVVAGTSRHGGALCPAGDGTGGGGGDEDDDDGGDDDGGGDAPGTGTIGYWKNHAEAWPVGSLTLGDEVYTRGEALVLLDRPVRGDITLQLAKQLIAAKLNVALGNPAGCIDATLAAADDYLAAHPPGSKPKGAVENQGEALKNTLDEYNNGRLCAPHRG